jgi:hypothetical protein
MLRAPLSSRRRSSSLKRRRPGVVRQVPLRSNLLGQLDADSTCAVHSATLTGEREDLDIEPRYGMAPRQGDHGCRWDLLYTSYAQGFTTRLRRQGVSIKRTTAPDPALARPRLAENNRHPADVIGSEERAFAERMWTPIFR